MKKITPDWILQSIWFSAAIFATGAFWYFLSQNNLIGTFWSGCAAAVLTLIAIFLHMRNDHLKREQTEHANDQQVVVKIDDEVVTFTELLRSAQFDVVQVHAHTHVVGVDAEYEWLRKRYPGCERIKQSLTTLDRIKGNKKSNKNQVHFDVLIIKLTNGKKKDVYFDISSFFSGGVSSLLNPDEFIGRKLDELYKKA